MRLRAMTVLQSILIVLLLCVAVAALLFCAQKRADTTAEREEQETTEEERIYLSDPSLGEMWIPVLKDVPVCSHEPSQTVTRNGLVYYMEDNKITSAVGVDVSSHQGNIDWETVKAAGVDFAMLRCGLRTYGSGLLVPDELFSQNLTDALAAGLDVGVYFYSQAINVEEAIEEANMAIDMIGDNPITYPIAYDWEIVSTDDARTDDVSVDMLTDCTKAFCDTVAAAGYTPMVYQNKRTSLLKLDLSRLTDYDFWLAEYNQEATYYYDYRIWQYRSDGQIPGISGDVDLNICYEPYTAEVTS